MSSSDFDKVAEQIEQLSEDVPDEVFDAVDDGVDETERQMKTELRANDTTWNGDLWLSLFTEKRRVSKTRGRYKVGSDGRIAMHNKFVEFGTGLHWGSSQYRVPAGVQPYSSPTFSVTLIENILEWVETKPVVPKFYDSMRDLAGAIAQNQSDEGMPSQPFIRPAWFRVEPKLKRDVIRAVNSELNEVR